MDEITKRRGIQFPDYPGYLAEKADTKKMKEYAIANDLANRTRAVLKSMVNLIKYRWGFKRRNDRRLSFPLN